MLRRWNARLGSAIPALLLVAACGSRAPLPEEPEVEEDPRPGSAGGLPATIREDVTTCQVTLTLRPVAAGVEDPGPGLRSVVLYVEGSTLLEPPATWPDGSPVGGDAALARAEMERLLDAFAGAGFFDRALRLVSARHADPLTSRPDGVGAWPPDWPDEPHLEVSVQVHDVDWYHHWVAPVALADGPARLSVLGGALEGRPAELVAALASETARAAQAGAPDEPPAEGPADGGPAVP